MILVIDDNKDLVALTRELLSAIGYETEGAYGGKEGIAIAKELKPQVILCDIGMEEMNGHDVARYIRNDNNLKGTYLIAISGYARKKDIELSLQAGFNRHFAKPVSIGVLKPALEEALKAK